MPKAKKKEVYLFDCNECDNFKSESWDEVEAHSQYTHASVADKVSRGDYNDPEWPSPFPVGFSEKAKAARDAYRNEQDRLMNLFKHDLEVEHAVEANPKKDKLFELAWSLGHAYGYSEVANYYQELVELIS